MKFKDKLVLPEHLDTRVFLKDPTESAFISDLAIGMETDLNVLNVLVSFEEMSLTPNACVYLADSFGLEANKFAEVVKRGYYTFKLRAKQLINYVFNFFLELLRGSTDVKGILKSYAKKTEQYLEHLSKLRIDHDESKKIEVRDVTKRLVHSVYTIEMTCLGLNTLLNTTHSNEKSKDSAELKVMKFVRGVQVVNTGLDITKFLNSFNDEKVDAEFMDYVKNGVIERFKDNNLNVSDESDVTKKVDSKISELKKLYDSEYKVANLTLKSAYEYINNGLKFIERRLNMVDELEHWDFKNIAKKISVVKDELVSSLDEISNEDNLNNTKENENLAIAIKNIMQTGSYMSKTKDMIAISLKSFKADTEALFTESKKVGATLYQKQQ